MRIQKRIQLSAVSERNMLVVKWEINRDKDGSSTALLTDLSKAFEFLLHEVLIAKLHAYRFDMARLKLIYIKDTHREKTP